ncbi:hypothetical protein ABZU76_49115 [Amycolatopsis sp. NPDC005232]|uniref:hypothetical protein n=1 Tax=Amycolatopsis sp. NPDC005232 TaxID=3157027 RepID=UPI0033AEE3B8
MLTLPIEAITFSSISQYSGVNCSGDHWRIPAVRSLSYSTLHGADFRQVAGKQLTQRLSLLQDLTAQLPTHDHVQQSMKPEDGSQAVTHPSVALKRVAQDGDPRARHRSANDLDLHTVSTPLVDITAFVFKDVTAGSGPTGTTPDWAWSASTQEFRDLTAGSRR